MIREPTVGMRVEVSRKGPHGGWNGDVIRIDTDGFVMVQFNSGENWPFYPKGLTEIKESDMYLDEALKVIREDEDMELSRDSFKNWYDWETFPKADSFKYWYMCSDFKVRNKKPKVKELTVADIEKMVGGPVKIVKE